MELDYVNSATVYINGTPAQAGTYNFTLRVENEIGSDEQSFSIVVQDGAVKPTIIDDYTTIPYAIVGKAYEYQLRATGTNTQENPIIWSLNDETFAQNSYDLGNGLTLSKEGLISGTPTQAGQVDLTSIYAKNTEGTDSEAPYLMVYNNGAVTKIVVTPEETVIEKGSSKQFNAEVFGYGDVSQTIDSWDTSMYVDGLGAWFPRPQSEYTTLVNGLLTIGEDETREQIMVVAIVGSEKGYAMVTIVEKGTATHSITFDSNEGTGSMSNLQYIDGYEYTLPTCTFTAPTGKQFKCWSVGGQEKAVGDTITLNADVTIVAIWEDIPVPTSLTATYTGTILAGTTINPSGISITLTYSDDSTEPVSAGNVEYWHNGQQITNPVAYVFGVELIGNLNITIKYEGLETTMAVQIVGHAITFNANGGTGEMTATEYVGVYTLPANGFTAPQGKQFKGWSLTNNGEVIGTTTYNVTEPITLYAIWEDIPVIPESLTATYTGTILAGTTINPSGISITLTYSDDSTEPVSAGDVEYWYNGQQITNPVAYVFGVELIGNLNITIKYEGLETTMAVQIVGHAITFNANGGTGEMTATEYVGDYTLPANEFTAPTGKQFKGWALTNNGEVITTATHNVTEPITLYAIWEDIPAVNYTISFNANGGTGTMANVEYAGTYTLPTCTFTAPTGKQFKGWSTTANGEVIDGTTINISADTELFAIWEDTQTPPINPDEPEQPQQPEDTNKGLGVGAIIGIVLASLVVLGTGGFALVWFVIKKKSWADFIAIFKKK